MYDKEKIEFAILAIFGALEFENGRVWKNYRFEILDSLHEKGLIDNPSGKSKSIYLTNKGYSKAKTLAEEFFGEKI